LASAVTAPPRKFAERLSFISHGLFEDLRLVLNTCYDLRRLRVRKV
jgi:hypothetical protein